MASTADYVEADFDRVRAVNLKGIWLGMRTAIPQMLKQGKGAIINTSTRFGIVSSHPVAIRGAPLGMKDRLNARWLPQQERDIHWVEGRKFPGKVAESKAVDGDSESPAITLGVILEKSKGGRNRRCDERR